MGDFSGAKPVLEKAWRQYPFVRVRHEGSGVWMPAQDAYAEWLTIGWMDNIRAKKMSQYPFDPNQCLYHNAKGGQGLMKQRPFTYAVQKIFDADGPQLLETAMEQMLMSDDFKKPDRSDFICAYLGDEMIGFIKMVYRGEVADIGADAVEVALIGLSRQANPEIK